MLKINILETDIPLLKYERYNNPHPRVMLKMDVLYLKSLGFSNDDICKITGVCGNTMRDYWKQYNEGGIERLKEVKFYKPISELQEHSSTIEKYFTENPPSSISQASAIIEKLTGIKRGETQVRKFLKSMNFRFIKSCSVPAKALTEEKKKEQREFLEKELEPRLAEAKDGMRKVYFVDAAHFVLGSFLAYLWCITRIFIPSSSGRKRYNVLGAIDAITHELITVCNDTYINAFSVCELLHKIRDAVGADEIITLVLDNAAYQKCALVAQIAQALNIELLFLPSYSPNLNLIERLWKWVRKDCLNSKYFENFDDFRYAIYQSLMMVSKGKQKKEMESLLALNFQLYDSAKYERG
jgi:transposase